MKRSWTHQYLKLVIGTCIVLVLFVSLLAHDFWYIDQQCEDESENFRFATSLSEQAASLAALFRLQGWIVSRGCADKARELFYEKLSTDEQLALFDPTQEVAESDRIVLVQGSYGALANVDQTEPMSPLLRRMFEALEDVDETDLKDEIVHWLRARNLVRQEEYSTAKYEYDQVLEVNRDNLAALYERARVLSKLNQYEETLTELERVLTVAQETNEPGSDQIRQESRALIEPDSELASALAAASEEEYPTLKRIASTPMATATATRVMVVDRASQTPSATITVTPSFTAEPSAEILPTLSATVTIVTMTPTSTLTVAPISTLTMTPTSTLTATVTSMLPTATATNTPMVMPTSTPMPTVVSPASVTPSEIPTVTSQPTERPTVTAVLPEPTAAQRPGRATDTPFVPTNTPIPSNTPFVPTNTSTPSNTPFVPTNTSTPSNTPFVPTSTPIPSHTPIPTPSNTPFVPTSTPVPPTNTPATYPVPVLLAPESGVSISQNTLLQWSWNGTLQEDEYFDVRVWREGDPAYGISWTKEPSFLFDPGTQGDGSYFWSITVIRGKDGQWVADLSDPATPRSFTISGAAPPPPTSTPPP